MKTRLLKITLSFALIAFFGANVFGQTYPGTLYENTDEANQIDSVTAGVTVPFYVTPDDVLNDLSGSYDPNGGEQSLNSTWIWFDKGGTSVSYVTQGEPDNSGDGNNDGPYIEANWPSHGGDPSANEDTLFVTEQAPAGGCSGDTSMVRVQVFDQPGFTPVSNQDGIENTDSLIEKCGTINFNINLATIEDNYVGTGQIKVMLDISVDEVTASETWNVQDNYRTSNDTVAYIDAVANGLGDGTNDENVTLLTDYFFTARNGNVTRYTFSFGASDDGISDQVSRASDYLNVPTPGTEPSEDQEWTYYDASENTDGDGTDIAVVMYPKPTTGNIHYVPNNFDQ